MALASRSAYLPSMNDADKVAALKSALADKRSRVAAWTAGDKSVPLEEFHRLSAEIDKDEQFLRDLGEADA